MELLTIVWIVGRGGVISLRRVGGGRVGGGRVGVGRVGAGRVGADSEVPVG